MNNQLILDNELIRFCQFSELENLLNNKVISNNGFYDKNLGFSFSEDLGFYLVKPEAYVNHEIGCIWNREYLKKLGIIKIIYEPSFFINRLNTFRHVFGENNFSCWSYAADLYFEDDEMNRILNKKFEPYWVEDDENEGEYDYNTEREYFGEIKTLLSNMDFEKEWFLEGNLKWEQNAIHTIMFKNSFLEKTNKDILLDKMEYIKSYEPLVNFKYESI
jgi:hypothetical protein